MERNARKQGKVGFFSYMIQPVQRLPVRIIVNNYSDRVTIEIHLTD